MKKNLIIKSIVIAVFACVLIAAVIFATRPQFGRISSGIAKEDSAAADNCISCHRQAVESRQQAHLLDFKQIENEPAKLERSCAECHGNTTEHLQAAMSFATRTMWESDENSDRRIIQPQKLDSDRSMLICASCHGSQSSSEDSQTRDVLLAPGSFESEFRADGTARVAGREYQGIVNSPCFLNSKSAGHNALSGEKINCLTCHAMHESGAGRLKPLIRTNQACTQCHEQFTEPQNLQNHTKHIAGSAASNCVSCHMPEVVYAEKAFRPTHQISNPRPEMTALEGVPNACSQCHVEQSVNWAIGKTKNLWSGYASSQIVPDKNFDQPEAVRMLFAGAPLERALAAENLRKYAAPDFAFPYLAESFATDDYPVVRFFTADALVSIRADLPKPEYLAAPEVRRKQINRWFDKIDRSKLIEVKNLSVELRGQRKNTHFNAAD